MEIKIETKELLSIPEAAKVLGIGRATLYRRISDGTIHPLYLAGRALIPQVEIDKYLGVRSIPSGKNDRPTA